MMEIVKKNILSVICGVIALAALIASVWPLGSFVGELQTDLDTRKGAYDALLGLKNKGRTLPVLKLESTQAEPLVQFPNAETIKRGESATDSVAQESKNMLEAAVTLNQHQLLVAGSLPAPSEPLRYKFRQEYQVRVKNLPDELLNAGRPPSPESIKEAQTELWESEFKSNIIMLNGKEANLPEVQAEYEIASARLPDQLRLSIAREKSVYVDENAIGKVPGIEGVGAPDPVNIWSAQLSLWVHEDLFNAIADANAGRPIVDAPIKRLVRLDVPQSFTQNIKPGEVVATSTDPSAPLPKSFAGSVTGRVSNPLFDVVTFKLSLHVNATQVPEILSVFNRSRLINVLRMDIDAVDALAQLKQGYYYGTAPVVQIDLDGEILYLRSWTVAFMPERIRSGLGIGNPAAPVEAAE